MERSLIAWINHDQVGTLREVNGIWAFRYDEQWLTHAQAYPLCPLLPLQADEHLDGSTRRPVQWYFDNLLPEEGQRRLIANDAGASIEDAFALLQHVGAESAGSLTLLPPGEAPQPGGSIMLMEQSLSQRIQAMPRIGLSVQSAKKMSLAGAQHKMAVMFQEGYLVEPVGQTPSTHILKPDHPGEAWPHSVINEWFVMTLAKRVGLPVPNVHRMYVPEPVYLIERFDRAQVGDDWRRLHCIDACQLDGLAKESKYRAGSIERMAELASKCRPAAFARLRIFEWLVFNVLVGNEDAHLKNLSFLLTARSVSLAPFYDLLCTAAYGTRALGKDEWPQLASLAWPLLGVIRLQEIRTPLLVAAGEAMGIKPATAKDIVRKLVDGVRRAAPKLLTEVETQNAELVLARPELAATFAGEMRLIRCIHSIVIGEMLVQLQSDL